MKKIGIIIIIYLISLIIANVFCRTEYDKIRNEYQALIINSNENISDILNNIQGITNQKRALSFYKGEDNNIIYSPNVIYNPDGSTSSSDVDESKLIWSYFYVEQDLIYAFSASDCNSSIGENEVILQLHGVDKKSLPYSNAISKEIIFKYNNSLITLKIKDIVEADIYSNICISDDLYNKLLPNEKKYIYALRFDKYKNFQNAADKLYDLSNNNISISQPSKVHDTSNRQAIFGDIIDFLSMLNIITIIIIFILIIYLIVSFLNKKLNKSN